MQKRSEKYIGMDINEITTYIEDRFDINEQYKLDDQFEDFKSHIKCIKEGYLKEHLKGNINIPEEFLEKDSEGNIRWQDFGDDITWDEYIEIEELSFNNPLYIDMVVLYSILNFSSYSHYVAVMHHLWYENTNKYPKITNKPDYFRFMVDKIKTKEDAFTLMNFLLEQKEKREREEAENIEKKDIGDGEKSKTGLISMGFLPKDDPIFSEGLQMFTIRRPLQQQHKENGLNKSKQAEAKALEELQKKDREKAKIKEQTKNRLKRLARIRRDRSKRLSKQ